MSVPLLVATVFGATFLVVCAIAYVLLGRNSSAAQVPASVPPAAPATPIAPMAPIALELSASQPVTYEIHAVRGGTPSIPAPPAPAEQWAPPLDPGTPASTTTDKTVLRFYRVLMFATGGTGILASGLMFSAVTEFSRLIVIAAVVFVLSCGAIYRGFVPDPELTGKK